MSDGSGMQTYYVPLPADLWAQAAYLTMRPTVVREQASAMLVRVVRAATTLAQERPDRSSDACQACFADLPAEKQAWVVGLLRNVLTRFATTPY